MRGGERCRGSSDPIGPQRVHGDFHPVPLLELFEILSSFHQTVAGTNTSILDATSSGPVAVGQFADRAVHPVLRRHRVDHCLRVEPALVP